MPNITVMPTSFQLAAKLLDLTGFFVVNGKNLKAYSDLALDTPKPISN